MESIRTSCSSMQGEIIALRRGLHQIPELGTHLPETRALICETLDRWGVPYQKSALDSSVSGSISGGAPGKTVLLRADVDGLPIREETGLPFTSRHPGIMHACGHDAHGAMLLGAVKALFDRRETLCGTVRFLFQASEEDGRGAKNAIAEGILDGVDAVFGMHVGSILGPEIPSGTVTAAPGCCMAAADRFILKVRGAGCHGSTPEKGVDPVSISAHIILALQEIIAREISSTKAAVVTVGRISGGAAYNIIPDEVELEGTLRCLERGVRDYVLGRIAEIARSEAALFRGSCEVEIIPFAPPVISDPAMAALVARAAREVVGETRVRDTLPASNMGAEDFAFYLERVPGCYFFLSAADPEKGTCIPHHNARFDVDESVLWEGSAVLAAAACRFLNGEEA